jgi:uncharacterized Zn-finger protein
MQLDNRAMSTKSRVRCPYCGKPVVMGAKSKLEGICPHCSKRFRVADHPRTPPVQQPPVPVMKATEIPPVEDILTLDLAETLTCPFCDGVISAGASKCKHCAEWVRGSPTKRTANADQGDAVANSKKRKAQISYGVSTLIVTALVIWIVVTVVENAPWHDKPVEGPALPVAVLDLIQEYEANEVAADGRYKDKIVLVTGRVTKVAKDILGSPYILLDGGVLSITQVQCSFPDSAQARLADLAIGQVVSVRGRCNGKLLLVVLDHCVLEN